MKKVCCIFFICLVILSGLSIPTFAVSIGNCTEKNLLPLKIATNAMFDKVVNSKEARWDCGQLLDFISYSDLLSEFYMTKCKFKEVDQYRVKKCVFQSALIKSMCYDCTDTKFVDLELYFLKKATDILEKTMKFYDEDQKMFNLISKLWIREVVGYKSFFLNYDEFYKWANENNQDCICNGAFIVTDICLRTPKNDQEFKELMECSKDILYRNCSSLLNKSDLFIPTGNIQESTCVLKSDKNNAFKIKYVIENILMDNFTFGNGQTHIALGIFDV